MPNGELTRRVEKVVGYRPLCDMGEHQRREFLEAESGQGPATCPREEGIRVPGC